MTQQVKIGGGTWQGQQRDPHTAQTDPQQADPLGMTLLVKAGGGAWHLGKLLLLATAKAALLVQAWLRLKLGQSGRGQA